MTFQIGCHGGEGRPRPAFREAKVCEPERETNTYRSATSANPAGATTRGRGVDPNGGMGLPSKVAGSNTLDERNATRGQCPDFREPLRAEFENEARGGREGGGSLVADVQIVSKAERLERFERF